MTDTTVATADDLAQEVQTSVAGQDMLVAQVSHITNQVESLAVERIDALIFRLTSLKNKIILENKASIERTKKFITLVDGGLRQVDHLENLASDLETASPR